MKYLTNTPIMVMMVLLSAISLNAQNNGVLTRISSSEEMDAYTTGYKDASGNTVIPIGKYVYCFTDTFDKVAIVLYKAPGDTRNNYYAIDRAENLLFKVAAWDNSPDEVRDGLFRIIVRDKIGFANMNGDIVIQPVFSAALPFSEGLAAFCIGGIETKDGEYLTIKGGKWGFVDTKGVIRIPAQFDKVSSFKDSLATVRKNGETYRIDVNGNKN